MSMKSILLINVKLPTNVVGILTFISRINTISESFIKARKIFTFHYFSFNEQLKSQAELS